MSQKPPIEAKPMCNLTEKSPAELNAMTKAQLIEAVLEGVERSVPEPIVYDEHGRPQSQSTPVTDAYSVLKRSEAVAFTYYGEEADSPVDVVTVTTRDEQGEVVGGHRVKHYTDGRPPEMLPLDGGTG